MTKTDKQSLRKAAIHAKNTGDWGCDADNFHEKATPDAVLALLDELEAAERQNGYLREQRDEWERKAIGNFEECSEMAARIAELEARTLTVKLPQGYVIRPGHPINESKRGVMIPKDGGEWLSRIDVEIAIRAAGIALDTGE